MELVDCIRKWPAIYSITAAIMDDVSLDRDKAQEKWGIDLMSFAEASSAAPIVERDVERFMRALAVNLNVAQVLAPIDAYDPPTNRKPKAETGTGKSVSSVPAAPRSATGASAPSKTYAKRPKRKPEKFVGRVTDVGEEEKPKQYGGGTRPVMVVKADGVHYGMKGTVPRALVGKVGIGDRIEMQAELYSYDNKMGYFRYPSDAKVLV